MLELTLTYVSIGGNASHNKTHVRFFSDTDLHEVIWHFAPLSSTDRVKISVKEAIQNGFLFLSHT